LLQFDEGDEFTDLRHNITRTARRYVDVFAEVVDKILGQIRPEREEYIHDDVRSPNFGIFLSEFIQANDNESLSDNHVPSSLRRRFRITFKAEETEPPVKLRQIRASSIGHLVNFRVSAYLNASIYSIHTVTFQGICTRISDVKPLIEVACFTCDICDQATYQVQSFSSADCLHRTHISQEVSGEYFSPLMTCPSKSCKTSSTGKLIFHFLFAVLLTSSQ